MDTKSTTTQREIKGMISNAPVWLQDTENSLYCAFRKSSPFSIFILIQKLLHDISSSSMQAITELWKHRQNLEDTLTADLTRLMVYPPDFNLPRLSSAALSNTLRDLLGLFPCAEEVLFTERPGSQDGNSSTKAWKYIRQQKQQLISGTSHPVLHVTTN